MTNPPIPTDRATCLPTREGVREAVERWLSDKPDLHLRYALNAEDVYTWWQVLDATGFVRIKAAAKGTERHLLLVAKEG